MVRKFRHRLRFLRDLLFNALQGSRSTPEKYSRTLRLGAPKFLFHADRVDQIAAATHQQLTHPESFRGWKNKNHRAKRKRKRPRTNPQPKFIEPMS